MSYILVFFTFYSYYTVGSRVFFYPGFFIYSIGSKSVYFIWFFSYMSSATFLARIRLFFAKSLLKSSTQTFLSNCTIKNGLFFILQRWVTSSCYPKFFLKYRKHCLGSKNFSIPQKQSLLAVLVYFSSSWISVPSLFIKTTLDCCS